MSRRTIQVFNMSFLDMMTNFLGAVIVLFLLAAMEMGKIPYESVKGTGKVVFNDKTRELSGLVDPSVLTNLKAGDTLLVIVERTTSETPKKETDKQQGNTFNPPPNDPGVVLNDDQMIINKSEFQKAQQNPEAACVIFPEVVNVSACNDNGTPTKGDDDYYTAEVKVSSAGKCSSSRLWKDDKGAAVTPYEKSKTYTFKMKDGPQKITYSDLGDASITKVITVPMPNPCVKKEEIIETGTVADFPPPPGLNFQIEFDEKQGNVDIYVEKDGRWVYGGRRKDERIGDWDNEKIGMLGPKTGLERVRQTRDIAPGTYKVYAHYRQKDTSPPTLKVTLYVSNQKSRQAKRYEKTIPQSRNNPKSGGGTLLRTVTVGPDGKITNL